MVFVAASITGVDVTPCHGLIVPLTGASPDFRSDVCHSGAPLPKLFASNAYTLSCSVATYTTLCLAPLIVTPDITSGSPYAYPSSEYEKSFPKALVFTFARDSEVSFLFNPL